VLTRERTSELGRGAGAELGRGASAVPGVVVLDEATLDEATLDEATLDEATLDVLGAVDEAALEGAVDGGSLARGASLGGRLVRRATGAKSKRSTCSTISSTGASSFGTRGGRGSVGPSPLPEGGALDGRLRTMSLGALRTT
jgi:hypothetical protein